MARPESGLRTHGRLQPNRLAYRGAAEPRLIPVAYVSTDFFRLLGARPILGRPFDDASTTQVVISYNFWRTHLHSDPAAIGKHIAIGSVDVAAVLAPGFQFHPWDFDVYLPVAIRAHDPSWVRSNHPAWS